MKQSLSHLPEKKQAELQRLREKILDIVPETEFIILFGSHARGDWVDDEYQEDHITYSYKSDFDILAITKDKETSDNESPWAKVENEYYGAYYTHRTTVDIICHHIREVNLKLKEGHYFFTDIKKEGILLYSSGNYELNEAGDVDMKRRAEIAQDDFEQWFESANEFYIQYGNALRIPALKNAAFQLHQAVERFYGAALLVSTGYKPKTHNIEKLGKMIAADNPEFIKIFPKETPEEDRLFKLLKKAYIDARYKKDYSITGEELKYLSKRVEMLKDIVEKTSRDIIERYKKSIG